MRIEPELKLDYADVLIRPKRSTLKSRADVDLNRDFTFLHTGARWSGFPIIAANMDTTGTFAMAKAFARVGALVALHKHYGAEKLIAFLKSKGSNGAFYSLGTTSSDLEKLRRVATSVSISKINIDVANGYTESFVSHVRSVRDEFPRAIIMAGNVVTGEMTEALLLAGADIVKVGVGSGSVCTTRRVTGVGYPQLAAVIECADAAHGLKGQICADGGCREPGDIAKAFGGGADFVMLGGMLAGHTECEGRIISRIRNGKKVADRMVFYGMSSEDAMKRYSGGKAPYRAAEGKRVEVAFRGPVLDTVEEIMGGVRSMMTYIGATRLKEIPRRTTFLRIASAGASGSYQSPSEKSLLR